MVKRNAKLAVLLMSAAMVACSQHEEFLLDGEADGTEIVTSVTVSTPEVFGSSRSVPEGVYDANDAESTLYPGRSGMSSFGGVTIKHTGKDDKGKDITWYESVSNVDLHKHPLTYTVGVYVATTSGEGDAATTTYTLVDKQAREKHTDAKASFNFHLLKGRPYKIVAYADYDAAAKTDLENIPVTFGLNDELKDAFFASQDFTASEQLNVVLRRPFGKLRLMASDVNTFTAGNKYKINKVKVTFKTPHMLGSENFNALAGTFDKEAPTAKDVEMEAKPVAYAMEYDANGKADTAAVFTMYLPANMTNASATEHGTLPDGSIEYIEDGAIPDSWMYPFDVTVDYEEAAAAGEKSLTHTRSFAVDIPVKRNWLTTVYTGEFWTDNSNITVSIDHRFQGEINYTPEDNLVKTADELQAAINKACAAGGVARIKLGGNIVAEENKEYPGGFCINSSKEVDIYLDLNGYKITADGSCTPKYTHTNGKEYSIGGVIAVRHHLNTLHIDDSSKDATGGIELKSSGEGDDNWNILVYCANGGQVVINGGSYIKDRENEVIYAGNTASWFASAQGFAFKRAGITKDQTEMTAEQKNTVLTTLKDYCSTITINGGWFQNSQDASGDNENQKVCINAQNIDVNMWTAGYEDENVETYGNLAAWGKFPVDGKTVKGITFCYVYLNGGSYVNFNPEEDNMGPGPENWEYGTMDWVDNDKFKVLSSVVEGKTVYTVVPKKAPNMGDDVHYYPSTTL